MTAKRVEHIGEGITLYLGDCRDVLPSLGRVDAVVTDPPYGIGYQPQNWKQWNGNKQEWNPIVGDGKKFDPSPWLQFPHAVLWGANYYSDVLPLGTWLVWDKRCHERGDKMFGASIEMAWCNIPQREAKIKRLLHGGVVNADSEIGNNEKRLHPTQKPIGIMSWCIEQLPPESKIILDPYMGSGTTGIACVKLDRAFVGVEIDPDYFDTAWRRIEQATKQGDLFIRDKPQAWNDMWQRKFDYSAHPGNK